MYQFTQNLIDAIAKIEGVKAAKGWHKPRQSSFEHVLSAERIYITLDKQDFDTKIFFDVSLNKLKATGIKRTDEDMKNIIVKIKNTIKQQESK